MKDQWTYIPIANVPDIENMQSEFMKIYNAFYKHMLDNDIGHEFGLMGSDTIRMFAKSFMSFLNELGIDDILKCVFFSSSKGDNRSNCPIHIDSKIPYEVGPALNIPVIGCDQSWTVLYDVGEHQGREKFSAKSKQYTNSVEWPEEEAVEMIRIPATQAFWLNTSIPHRPVTDHTDLRIVITGRFTDEIYNRMTGLFK